MRKLFKPFIALFKGIYHMIDRFIVLPISRLIYKISEISRDNSGKLEKILNRPNVLIYISLICAIGIFVLVDSKVISLTEREAEIITGQKVQVTYNKEAYVVEGIPESVDITLIGSKSTIYLATQLGEHQVMLDLSNYGPGTHKVQLKYNHNVTAVDYKLDPKTITIKISEKVSKVKALTADLVNVDKLDSKLSISDVKLDTNEVIVKSSQEILDRVATVKALVDASQIDLKDSGNFTIENVTLVAYDELGNKIDNIEIVPGKVSATVTIDSYHTTVGVQVVTTGKMSNGKAIANMTSSVKEVTIYGEKSVIDKIPFIKAEIDVSSLEKDKTFSVNLIKPSGVRYMSETTTNVTIAIGEEMQKTISGIKVRVENRNQDYTVYPVDETDNEVDVIVKGVKSVVDKEIDASKITASVDVTGLKPGTYKLKVQVYVDDERVTVQAVKTEITVNVKLDKK